ncbi:MAG: hypothetical protein C5B50_17660 [Verrucomicrobia bacterium]|nr:MAG: hypothetical protein C5B50_17660 [Verrucomicrobiota bacterium]
MSSEAKILYEDVVGAAFRSEGPHLPGVTLPDSLQKALLETYGVEARLSPPQEWALDHGVLRDRCSYVISAPTNSGKTLIAVLRIFVGAIETGSRHVYVVPLKALAEEKAEDFRALARRIAAHGGPEVLVTVSTGDYQITSDFFGSPPPAEGQIMICTPERLEVILRNPDNYQWARQVATYCVDEFHLLGEKERGSTVEILLTRLMALCPDSSLIGLSATIGGIDAVASWLSKAGRKVLQHESAYRFPPMYRKVVIAGDKDGFVAERVRNVLNEPQSSLLIFVYRKADAEKLAKTLKSQIPVPEETAFFHAGLSLAERKRIVKGFRDRTIRILVTTTSLKMGVNTPATEVIVRDTFFPGAGRLKVSDLLQMAGRAGRGETPGRAWILVDREDDADFLEDLANGRVDDLVPQLVRPGRGRMGATQKDEKDRCSPLLGIALTEVVARGRVTAQEIAHFVSNTFSATKTDINLVSFHKLLIDLERGKLIYQVENSQGLYSPTKLGRTVSLTGISPESGAMLGGFLRAMISLSVKEAEKGSTGRGYLRHLTDLDLLFLAVAAFEARDNWLPRPSSQAIEGTQSYLESLAVEEKPVVNLWRDPQSKDFPTARLLSSLKINFEPDDAALEKVFYRLMRTAQMLHRHSCGLPILEIAAVYGIHAGMFESGLKPTITWVLNCLAQICDSDKAYKLDFLKVRIYELLENLSLGATLGRLLDLPGIGRKTVEKLVGGGVITIDHPALLNADQLQSFGLTTSQASTISSFAAFRRR